MRENHCEIAIVLDRSGSMSSIKSDAIGGYNSFIESQKKVEGTASVSLYLFDDQYDIVYENKDIQSVSVLTEEIFIPRGMTALYDAMGKTINTLGEKFETMKESDRPSKVLVAILTDGAENKSQKFTSSKIKEMIEHQRSKYSWEFAFLAANQDAFLTGGDLGISKDMTMNFMATASGTRGAYATLNAMSTSYRTNN